MGGGAACGALLGGRLKVAAKHPVLQGSVMVASRRSNMVRLHVGSGHSRMGAVFLACSSNGNGGDGGGNISGQRPPQEAVLKAISEVSRAEGRVAQTTNMVIGGTISENSDDEWNLLDQKVNKYPMAQSFTAIGDGGDDFVQAMVGAVESVLESPIPEGGVSQKLSAQGKYVSVKIGPVTVNSGEQARAVYDAMKRDTRMKFFF